MSTELGKAMEEYEVACMNLKKELTGLSDRLCTLSEYQKSLLTANTLLTSWLQNVEELWKYRRQTRLISDP